MHSIWFHLFLLLRLLGENYFKKQNVSNVKSVSLYKYLFFPILYNKASSCIYSFRKLGFFTLGFFVELHLFSILWKSCLKHHKFLQKNILNVKLAIFFHFLILKTLKDHSIRTWPQNPFNFACFSCLQCGYREKILLMHRKTLLINAFIFKIIFY